MNPILSILHASRGRPKKAAAAMRMWAERAVQPHTVEYILCADPDDETRFDLIRETRGIPGVISVFVESKSHASAPAWDFAAAFSRGDILIQGQDDIEPPPKWDIELRARFNGAVGPMVVAVGDGYRKDALCCTAIMNRERYWQCGEFLHAGYRSVFSDDEFSYRALRDARAGKCKFVNARDLIFLHRHHYHDPTVPMDETYAWENSPSAYEHGRKLFFERNPEAATDGLRTWR